MSALTDRCDAILAAIDAVLPPEPPPMFSLVGTLTYDAATDTLVPR
jgi:hypothetical protein